MPSEPANPARISSPKEADESQPATTSPLPSTQKSDAASVAEKVDAKFDEKVDVKEQFLQALQRKRGQTGDGHTGGPAGDTKIHGAHGKAANKRQFRRKSGG